MRFFYFLTLLLQLGHFTQGIPCGSVGESCSSGATQHNLDIDQAGQGRLNAADDKSADYPPNKNEDRESGIDIEYQATVSASCVDNIVIFIQPDGSVKLSVNKSATDTSASDITSTNHQLVDTSASSETNSELHQIIIRVESEEVSPICCSYLLSHLYTVFIPVLILCIILPISLETI